MAQPNYKFEKRQKDLAKKAKKLEKQQRKNEKTADEIPEDDAVAPEMDQGESE